ncbi:hypothetical protein K7X08_035171 [Anisodus acutangulus]|uniref:Uncharacterized protein n=1 Tax=Anisodus acutangulus TaxID=402998 RepID=A0A9Q1LI98_9SOLA|nr:hypothetical protein K7X08_035171 [Anisodus acutangulus]
MELAFSSGHEDQVEDQDLGGRAKETCIHCDLGTSVIANRLTSIEDELVVIHKLLETKSRRRSKCVSSSVSECLDGSHLSYPNHVDDSHDGTSSSLPDQVIDASYKTILLTDCVHVQNDNGFSSHFPDQVDDARYQPPYERITDVLAHIHGEDDIEEFGDAAQNGYETTNEEVV